MDHVILTGMAVENSALPPQDLIAFKKKFPLTKKKKSHAVMVSIKNLGTGWL